MSKNGEVTPEMIVFSTLVSAFRAVMCEELKIRKAYIPKMSDEDWCKCYRLASLSHSFEEFKDDIKDMGIYANRLTVTARKLADMGIACAWRLAQCFKHMFKPVVEEANITPPKEMLNND